MKRPRTPRSAVLAILAIGALTLSACSGADADAQAPQSFDGATATVTKGDLVGETTVQGTLHYADSYTLKSAFEGVVTALPTPGTTLTQGSHVYTVAGNNTYLLHGSTPAWRAFEEGMSDGEDVTQLESALSELGHHDDRDDHLGRAAARESWRGGIQGNDQGTHHSDHRHPR